MIDYLLEVSPALKLFCVFIFVLLLIFLVVFILYRIIIRRRARKAQPATTEDKTEPTDLGEDHQQLQGEVQRKRSLGSPVVGGLLGVLPHDP